MQLPKVHGVIGRRLLVNFRAEPRVIQRLLPSPFRPKVYAGYAVAGICLIRLENIRPKRFPRLFGLSSENAAHRIAVLWDDEEGSHEGVYIPRRDTGSLMNHLVGGRLFPGEHQRATFRVEDTGDRIALGMTSSDGRVQVDVAGRVATELAGHLDLSNGRRRFGVLRARFGRLFGYGFRPTARRRRLEDAFVERDAVGDRTRVFDLLHRRDHVPGRLDRIRLRLDHA